MGPGVREWKPCKHRAAGLLRGQFQGTVSSGGHPEANWKNEVQDTWSGKFGKFQVTLTVEELSRGDMLMSREDGINFVSITNPAGRGELPGSASIWEVKPGERRLTGAQHQGQAALAPNTPGGTAPHEVGHLLGLEHKDAALVGPRGGKIPAKTNLMTTTAGGRAPGARPTAKHIEKIVREHAASHPRK